MKRDTSLNQYFTPIWAAERIVQHYYPDLGRKDTVFDIGCGDGRFLQALPESLTAYGFEIDPVLAQQATNNTGREVIIGDVVNTPFPTKPTLILGNPPFELSLANSVIDRAFESLDYGNEVAFVLPVYFSKIINRNEYAKRWTLRNDLMPRNMFEGMKTPVMFTRFVKEIKTCICKPPAFSYTHN